MNLAEDPKPWWRSKTIWHAGAQFAVLVLAAAIASGELERAGFSPRALALFALVRLCMDVWLRFSTEKPIQ